MSVNKTKPEWQRKSSQKFMIYEAGRSDSTAAEKYFESMQCLWLELKMDIFWGTTRWEIVLIWYFAESLGKTEGATQLPPFSPPPKKKLGAF